MFRTQSILDWILDDLRAASLSQSHDSSCFVNIYTPPNNRFAPHEHEPSKVTFAQSVNV